MAKKRQLFSAHFVPQNENYERQFLDLQESQQQHQ